MRPAPRPRRRWDIRCEKCGYPLWLLEEPGCPECGHGRSQRRLEMYFLARSPRNRPHPDTRHCRQCGYLLRGTEGPYCPSCNTLVDYHGRIENERNERNNERRHLQSLKSLRRGLGIAWLFAAGAGLTLIAMALNPDWPRLWLIPTFLWQAVTGWSIQRGVRGEGWTLLAVSIVVGLLLACAAMLESVN